ncbi:TPA: glycosyltransferase family 4 protein [Bacillus wiedmannii]|nr:glycosyltransferase family 4 protein [Bacillus wiedmannii]
MKIGINLMRFHPSINIGGNYTFAYNIVREMVNNSKHDYYLFVNKDNKEMFKFDNANVHFIEGEYFKNIFIEIINENFFVKKNIKKFKMDVYYSPCFLLPFFEMPIPTIATIHDINFMHFSQGALKDFYKKLSYKTTLQKGTFISTVSNFTLQDVCEKIGDFSNKMFVTYNGCDISKSDLNSNFRNHYNLNGKFAVCFSHYEHKNAVHAIKVLANAQEQLDEEVKLVIVGAKGALKEKLIKSCRDENVEESVVFIEYLEEEYKASMYYEASVLLFPSKFEGFGLPVIEAMILECPVISSNKASIPEVMGDAGHCLDLDNMDEWVKSFVEIINNEELAQNLALRGIEHAKTFTWRASAQKIVNKLESISK